MKNLPMDLRVHVVSHTHWDREWRQPFEFFQPYLVKCLDQLFDIFKSDPKYKAFLLDGQAVMLDDYLEVCPERAVLSASQRKGNLPDTAEYLMLDVRPKSAAANIRLSCIKKSEDGDAIIIRLWNPTPQKVSVKLALPKPWGGEQPVMSDEIGKSNIPCDKNGYFTLAPFKIATFRFMKK
jgi:alpha-mannosidase